MAPGQLRSVIERVVEAASDPRKDLEFSRDDRDALVILRTIVDFDLGTGRPPDVKHPALPVIDRILELLR